MAIGCSRINEFYQSDDANIIESAFSILNDIGFNKYPPPDSLNISKDYSTQFTVLFDLNNLTVFFKTKSNPKIREIGFNFFSPACSNSMQMLEAEQTDQGNVNQLFQNHFYEANRKFLYDRLKNAKGMSQEVIEFFTQYPETYRCK